MATKTSEDKNVFKLKWKPADRSKLRSEKFLRILASVPVKLSSLIGSEQEVRREGIKIKNTFQISHHPMLLVFLLTLQKAH